MNPPKTVHIALGSNQGDRFTYLQKAIEGLHETVGGIVAVSKVYETPALGFEGASFLNACVAVNTRFRPADVLRELLKIENDLGRERLVGEGYQSRCIDLDILLFEGETMSADNLKIPHPEMHRRKFVLLPLSDIAAEAVHPLLSKTMRELLRVTEDTSEINVFPETLEKPSDLDFSRFSYIAVEGNIGAGKTSFATMVSQDYNAKLILERFKDNPFLPKFYEDQPRYAFSLEMSFLADRYQQLSDDIAQYDLFTDFVISDYDVFKSLIFAKITLQEDEYSLYHKLFSIMYKELVKPDLYIYLYQNTERLLENIKKRGRDYEQNIQQEYLANINQSYLSFIKSQPSLNVKIIDISELDFVNDRGDYLKLLREFI